MLLSRTQTGTQLHRTLLLWFEPPCEALILLRNLPQYRALSPAGRNVRKRTACNPLLLQPVPRSGLVRERARFLSSLQPGSQNTFTRKTIPILANPITKNLKSFVPASGTGEIERAEVLTAAFSFLGLQGSVRELALALV